MKKLLALLAGFFVLLNSDVHALTLYFWDANGATAGAGGPAPTGTWGVDAYWSTNGNGTSSTVAWPAGNYAVFSAGSDATGGFVVKVSGAVQVADIHVDLGEVTFNPATNTGCSLILIDGNTNGLNRLLSVGGKDPNAVATYNVPLTGATNITRYKRATLIFGATNTYSGSTTIEGGIIQLAAPNVIPTSSQLILANNDPSASDFNSAWQYTPAVLATGGFNQKLGTLLLNGTDPTVARMLDFAGAASTLAFDDSSGQDWGSYTLTITNYTPGADSLRFGTTSGGLTPTQLSQIQFVDFASVPGQIDSQGFVTPELPVITSITETNIGGGPSFVINWNGLSGRTYTLQSADSLAPSDWADLASDLSGDDPTYTDMVPGVNVRYYRMVLFPP